MILHESRPHAGIARPLIALVAVVALGAGVGAMVTAELPDTYRAEATLTVQLDAILAVPEYPGGDTNFFAAPLVGLVATPTVLGPVVAAVGSPLTARQLAHEISASSSEPGVVRIDVTDRSPEHAAQYANAVAARFVKVATAQTAGNDGAPTLTIRQVGVAQVPATHGPAPWGRNLAIGGLIGLLLAVATASVRGRRGATR